MKLSDFSLSRIITRSINLTLIYVAFQFSLTAGKDVLTPSFLNVLSICFKDGELFCSHCV